MKFIMQLLLAIVATIPSHAQETLYWSNGSSFPFKLIEATESIVKIAEMRGERVVKRSVPRENVLVAFNARGNYLLVSDLPADPAQASQKIMDFYNAPGPSNDLLIVTNPVKVIECSISYKSDNVVNYNTPAGVTAAINRNELALIIFRDGHHEFVLPPAESGLPLNGARMQVQKAIEQPAKKLVLPATETKAATQKASEPVQTWSEPVKPAPVEAVKESATTTTVQRAPAENAKQEPTAPAPKPTAPAPSETKALTNEELASYSTKGIRKVDEFVQYLNIISDKTLGPDKKDEAIDQAVKLFLADATIEVSSSNRQGKRKYPIKDYLTRLKLLPYNSTSITWNEVNYVQNLTQATDGNYYGTITGTQTFSGYGANSQDIMYSDVTQKRVKVKLQSYNKTVEGRQTANWDILLGNIGISVNQ